MRDKYESTISPNKTTFSPRMRNSPHHFSANVLPAYIRSTVSSSTRLAEARRGWKVNWMFKSSMCERRDRAYRTDHKSAARHEVFDHLSGRRASFLAKDKEIKGRVGDAHDWARGAGARADVLSTQSTREPDVVNGMSESMRSDSWSCFQWGYCKVFCDVDG